EPAPDAPLPDLPVTLDDPPPEPPARPAVAVSRDGVSYALMSLAPGLYEVRPPGTAPAPNHVQVHLPPENLVEPPPEPEHPPSYEWPEPEEADETDLREEDVEPPLVSYEWTEPEEAVEAPSEPPPPARLPLSLATNLGLSLTPGDTVAVTGEHLRLGGPGPA